MATKIHAANCLKGMGVKPIILQHDGLVLATGRVAPEHLQLLLAGQCSISLGYPQLVQIKPMPTHVTIGTSLLATRYIPYNEAIECSIFMSQYAPSPTGTVSQRGAAKRKALMWARQGFKLIWHLLASRGRKYIYSAQFIARQHPPRIPLASSAL